MVNATIAEQAINTIDDVDLNFKQQQLLTIRQFCEAFPWPSEFAMRAYVYRAQELGISDAFVRVKRRVLVSPTKFFTLIKQLESRSTNGGIYETTEIKKGANNYEAF